ncbi:hypothetical protein [Priestia megaterium]|jgi:hypothetical protein|uniref:Uncharacterized protein n=1 Tax=Priestia megaterium TaxID=1404 RepID=A0A6M6E3A4_PRIMG|nr:hypothetical protein [Priestia megaterium]MED4284964.1 hypothetical protein [Priestia megaterium]QJX80124.1 hypothetical protein FDZ14_28930 [Priestia megaterium]
MKKSIELLKKWHIEEPNSYQSIAPLNNINRLFSIKEKTVSMEGTQLEFLKYLQKECVNSVAVNTTNGSGRYFFKVGRSILELFILIENNQIKIEPYLLYNDSEVQRDIQKIVCKEYVIFCMLKKWGLQ